MNSVRMPMAVDLDVSAGLQRRELAQRLRRVGLADILAAAADDEVYTAGGKLSVVKLARKLGRHHSYVRRALVKARQLLQTAA
jgi:hypothetical protein